MEQNVTIFRRSVSVLKRSCRTPGCVIFTLGMIVGAIGIAVARSLIAPSCTCDSAPHLNTSVTTDVPLKVTVPSVIRQPSTTQLMNATEDDLVPVFLSSHSSCEEAFHQQQKKLKNSIRCQPVLHTIKVNEELERWDKLLDKYLLRPEEAVYRCPLYGLCLGGKRCLPTKVLHTPYHLKYTDDKDGQGCEKRDLDEHLECSCQ